MCAVSSINELNARDYAAARSAPMCCQGASSSSRHTAQEHNSSTYQSKLFAASSCSTAGTRAQSHACTPNRSTAPPAHHLHRPAAQLCCNAPPFSYMRLTVTVLRSAGAAGQLPAQAVPPVLGWQALRPRGRGQVGALRVNAADAVVQVRQLPAGGRRSVQIRFMIYLENAHLQASKYCATTSSTEPTKKILSES